MAMGSLRAAEEAGPPSPEKPGLPVPAKVEMVPVDMSTRRMVWVDMSEM